MCEKTGSVYPLFPEDCLKWLKTIISINWTVFKYGINIGDYWWRLNVGRFNSISANPADLKQYPGVMYMANKEMYLNSVGRYRVGNDIVVIDGQWRDECTKFALENIRNGGYLFINNYHQGDKYPASKWTQTDKLMKDYPMVIFTDKGNPEHKTAVWQIIKK